MRRWLPLVIAGVASLLFVRLGLWQLERRAERRAANVELAARLADTVTLQGRFLFDAEVVLGPRAMRGVPGVWIVTPLATGDDTVAVLRGFTPSPDARTARLAGFREPASTTVRGIWHDTLLQRLEAPPGVPPDLRVVEPLPVTEGPHLSYAVQWFAFALIALIGSVLLTRTSAVAKSSG